MWPLIAAILGAMGGGGAGAAGAGLGAGGLAAGSALTAPALMGMGAGTAGGLAAAAPAIGPTLGAAASLGGATPGIMATMFPNLSKFGSSAMSGNMRGAGGALGNMVGGQNLGNMIENPSWANLGKLGEGMGDKMALNMMTGGGQPNAQAPVGPGAVGAKVQKTTAMPEIEDPILQRMYQNLNPQRPQFASGVTQMKPWPQSPYPRRMSAI